MNAGDVAIDLELVAPATSPRPVRQAFAARFRECTRLDDLLLCVSEVLTNALLHAGTPIRVVAALVQETIRVEVSDGSIVPPIRRTTTELSTTGRGLHLLDLLTSAWGVEITAGGKTVWFEINGAQA